MYNEKSRGDKAQPCFTPRVNHKDEESPPLCGLSTMHKLDGDLTRPLNPAESSFVYSSSQSTELYALAISQKSIETVGSFT